MLKLKYTKFKLISIVLILIFLITPLYKTSAYDSNKHISDSDISSELQKIYDIRSNALKTGDYSTLSDCYDTSKPSGKYALDHEIKRVKYLKDWSSQKNIEFQNIKSNINIKKVRRSGNALRLSLIESYKFDYNYKGDQANSINPFGVGIRHTVSLINKNQKWLILSDWYTDCFEDSLQLYANNADNKYASSQNIFDMTSNFISKINSTLVKSSRNHYNRENAVAYADKYCGAAWGSSNDFKYNKKYQDYNGAGGDCTNFISQVLGDKQGGSLKINDTWHPSSRAWSNADGLKSYLLYSGRGRIIKVGTYNQLTNSHRMSDEILNSLQVGDLIAYEKGRGNIDHFAIITGFDTHNYPLVNSHTTDRYHVPWDLGWGNKDIRFFFIHVND
ncbi:amidase domain-containing protein [Clostridium sp. JN-1]|uniref:amidase domain-containing protein n=1 Tax=Clostridium sp. JN-1 TaxID=2483110 RepID=UPI000F0BD921|nr:amidase domain-containing protein [Clostridium sp. JN-1]